MIATYLGALLLIGAANSQSGSKDNYNDRPSTSQNYNNESEQEVDPLRLAAMLGRFTPQVEVDPLQIASLFTTSADGDKNNNGFENGTLKNDVTAAACKVPQYPFEINRAIQFFKMTEDAKSCSLAVRTIQSLKISFGQSAYSALKDPKYLADTSHALARNAVESYVEKCTKRFKDPVAQYLLGTENGLQILKSIGLLETDKARCVGTMVEGKILTARHCVSDGTMSQDGAYGMIPKESNIIFSNLLGEQFHVNFDGVDRSSLYENRRDKDWILLNVSNPPDIGILKSIKIRSDLATVFRPLLLISFSPYTMALRNNYNSLPDNATIDISPICNIMLKDKKYLFHACQTLAGMSGSPLLAVDNGQVAVVGVHTGDTNRVSTPCGQAVAQRYANYGVIPIEDEGDNDE